MNTLAPIVPNDLWLHTHFQQQGNYLVLTGYVVRGTKFKIFDLKLDLKKVLALIVKLHQRLHSDDLLISGDEIGDEIGRRSRRRRRKARRKARRSRRRARRSRRGGLLKRVARKISRSKTLRPIAKKVINITKRVPGINAGAMAVETAVRVAKGQKPGTAFKKALGRRLPARSLRRVLGNVKKKGLKKSLFDEGKRLLQKRMEMANVYLNRYAGKKMPISIRRRLKKLQVQIPRANWKKLTGGITRSLTHKKSGLLKKLKRRAVRFGKNKLRRTAIKTVRAVASKKNLGSLGRVLPIRARTLRSIAAAKRHLGLERASRTSTKIQKYAKKLSLRERSKLIRIARKKKLLARYGKAKVSRAINKMTRRKLEIKLKRIFVKAPGLKRQFESASNRNEILRQLLRRARQDPKAFKAKAVLKSILLHAARVKQIEKNRNDRGVTGLVVDQKGRLLQGRFLRTNTGKGAPNAIFTKQGVQSGFFERVGIGGESCVGCGPVAGDCVGCEPCVGVGCEPCVGCGPAYPLGPVLVR